MISLLSGIYKITHTDSGKFYIGSSINLPDRWMRHRKDLKAGRHHSLYLQRTWDKYGPSRLEFSVLCYCEPGFLVEQEERFLIHLVPPYNMCPHANSNRGRIVSDKEKADRREYAKLHGIRPPESTYAKKRKKVRQISKETGETLAIFESISDACRAMKRTHRWASMISACADGKKYHNTAWGFIWRWVN